MMALTHSDRPRPLTSQANSWPEEVRHSTAEQNITRQSRHRYPPHLTRSPEGQEKRDSAQLDIHKK